MQSPFKAKSDLYSGGYLKWNHEERKALFEVIDFISVNALLTRKSIWPKVRGSKENAVLQKLNSHPSLVAAGALTNGSKLFYKNTGLRYFNTVTRRSPLCKINGVATTSSRETVLSSR